MPIMNRILWQISDGKVSKIFFSQNGNRECLKLSEHSEILQRYHRSILEHIVERLWAKTVQISGKLKKMRKKL